MIKIGLTSSKDDRDIFSRARYIRYISNVCKKYGISAAPALLPSTDDERIIAEYIEMFDGFILTGGGDITPALFGEETHEKCGATDILRDKFEISLIRSALHEDKPMLGICRGIQVMNVALGGTLWQDIESELPDITETHRSSRHDVTLTGQLRDIIGAPLLDVNSYHHQAIKETGGGLEVCAVSRGGMIEGVSLPVARFLVGVQWHPEMEADEGASGVLGSFLFACGE